MIRSVKILFFMLLVPFTITAQQRLFATVTYNMSMPLNADFKDYINKTSYRGAQVAVLYDLKSHLRVGLQVSFNDFYERLPREVYQLGDGSHISAVLTNTLQYTPVLAKAEYSFLPNRRIRPYAGVGLGAGFINFEQYVGEFPSRQMKIKAAFSVAAGVNIPVTTRGDYKISIGTSYMMSPYNEAGIKNISTWNVQGGVVIPLK
jgi:opacity protein-like surface antigen